MVGGGGGGLESKLSYQLWLSFSLALAKPKKTRAATPFFYTENTEYKKNLHYHWILHPICQVYISRFIIRICEGWSFYQSFYSQSQTQLLDNLGIGGNKNPGWYGIMFSSNRHYVQSTGCSIMKIQNYLPISQARKQHVSLNWWQNMPIYMTFWYFLSLIGIDTLLYFLFACLQNGQI